MGTISDKLMRIINTKEDIRQALISKGYDVPTSIPFKEYAKMILDLPCKADSFPDIEGIVARYSALGLTNEQMAENPVWVDKTGNGHDLQLKNLAWGGMSGVGGYEMNFNLWRNNVSGIPDISMSTTTTSVSVSVGNSTYDNNLIYIHISNWDINKNHWLKVTSTYEDGDLAFIFYNNSNTKKIGLPANGYVNILAYPEFKGNYMYISTTSNKQGSFTIEQLPLYPGALVFDGVDDYGVCENFPILTKEKGYTVVALRQWITRGEIAQGLVSNVKNWLKDGAFLLEYRNIQADHLNKPISFGAIGSENDLPHILTYQTSKSYNGVSITTGNFEGTDVLHVGKLAPTNVGTCINAAIWELVFLDHDATEEELTKIKDYFVKTYPWLFPYQAWTVVGKTNEDEDRATIANITGNGNNLVLSNFGFAEGSGYGLYAQNYISYAITNRAVYTKTNSSIHVTKSITAGVNFTESARDVTIPSYRIKVTGIQSGQEMIYRGSNNTFLTNIPSDGIYVLPAVENGSNLGFQFVSYTGDCDITIEQIPEYEGYLVTDGVDDRVQDSSFKLNKDWTLVGEWVFLNQKATNAGITKPFSFVVYNRTTGLSLFINTGTSGITIENVKSIKAICSDGRIYFDDWSKMLISKDQDITSSTSVLSIGFNGTAYTQMAFKNLGIYNNQLLSKDDCIKAYNYLQTLKSK
jgi:hypothetical protein